MSGPGLANVYEFLAAERPGDVDAATHERFVGGGDMQGKAVSDGAKAGDALCRLAMQTFASAYGSEAGACALKFLPLGGLYLAGGLTPKNLDAIKAGGREGPFLSAFFDKGRVSPLLGRVPLLAVMAEDIGSRGAHLMAFRLLQKALAKRDPEFAKLLQQETARTLMRFQGAKALGQAPEPTAAMLKRGATTGALPPQQGHSPSRPRGAVSEIGVGAVSVGAHSGMNALRFEEAAEAKAKARQQGPAAAAAGWAAPAGLASALVTAGLAFALGAVLAGGARRR